MAIKLIPSSLLFFWVILMGVSNVIAQTPPDFTITDTKGNSWQLYAELAKGKTVILDFFFVDCVPCKTWSPEMQKVHEDYQEDSSRLLFIAISDRDDDYSIDTFKQSLGLNFPAVGYDGGGSELTSLYRSYYSFIGWPTYSIICPDTTIHWDIRPWTKGFPELRAKLDTCLSQPAYIPSQYTDKRVSIYPNPSTHSFRLNFLTGEAIGGVLTMYNTIGQLQLELPLSGFDSEVLWPTTLPEGWYIVKINLLNGETYNQIIYRQRD